LSLIKPFRALRPAPGRAAEVLAPPYDVLSSEEARLRAKGKRFSFLHISKPEIDLDPAIDPHDKAVYAKAAENLQAMIAAGVMIRDARPGYYVYHLSGHGRTQTGLACVVSLADYASNRVRKHELTTPEKEDDRVAQIEAVNAQTGPVMCGYPNAPHIDAMLAQAAVGQPEVDVTADDSVRHQLWAISDVVTIDKLTRAFDALPAIYIADGHHRSAAAARVAAKRQGNGSHQYFLSVVFPEREMTILDYNRVVKDLNQRSAEQFLDELRKRFTVTASSQPVRPASALDYGMYLAGRWYKLSIRPDLVAKDLVAKNLVVTDPIGRLPITVLTRNVIEPLLGIKDVRTDKRIDFIGGARGLQGLEARVNSGEMSVAFALYPTQMADLMAVADAGLIMPPKSTWFEPKLADGMVNHVLD
jgi:uncharacterized protein (DUF1015 family)